MQQAIPQVPVALKLMAEQAVIYHLELENVAPETRDKRISATKVATRRNQTVVHASFYDSDLAEETRATILVITDNMGRINIIGFEGVHEEDSLPYRES